MGVVVFFTSVLGLKQFAFSIFSPYKLLEMIAIWTKLTSDDTFSP